MSLDPILQQLLDQVPPVPEGPLDYPLIRHQAEALLPMIVGPAGLAEVLSTVDLRIEESGGPVPLRIYRPVGEVKGTLHYIHGGGWSVGNLAIIDPTARRLCRDTSMVVVTSSYRLAPEHPFPAAFDDSLAAAQWVSNHLAELGGEYRPAVIGGDSAGANLTAAVCIAMRDASERPFDLQLLLYPAVDLRLDVPEYESRQRDADPSLRSATMVQCYRDYLGNGNAQDPRASPLAASNLANLPPALMVVLTVDPLHDEAVAYANRLQRAGVKVELVEFGKLTHGFIHYAGLVPAAAIATANVLERMQIMLCEVSAV